MALTYPVYVPGVIDMRKSSLGVKSAPISALVSSLPGSAKVETYITPKQAAEFLAIAVSTLRDYSDRGIVPSHRLCKHRRYKYSELEAMMERNRIETWDSQAATLKDLLR